jgi:hypothetical protein
MELIDRVKEQSEDFTVASCCELCILVSGCLAVAKLGIYFFLIEESSARDYHDKMIFKMIMASRGQLQLTVESKQQRGHCSGIQKKMETWFKQNISTI